jgi:hypothetical protein
MASGHRTYEEEGGGLAGRDRKLPPRWFFTLLAVGGFVACGIYLGMIRAEGASTRHVVRAVGFGALGLLALWGTLGKR